MDFDRTQISIKLIGGPCDGDSFGPTDCDDIEVVKFPPPSLTFRSERDPPPVNLPYKHRYRRNMRRPWEFMYHP